MERKEKMIELRKKGLSYGAIGKLYNISRARVYQLTSGYTTKFNIKLRQLIFERDHFECQWGELCHGRNDRNSLIIHHIDFNVKNNNSNNLITLCRKCHLNFHCQNHIDDKTENRLKGGEKIKLRNEEISIIWEKRKSEISMDDLAKMFNLSLQSIYKILKEARLKSLIKKESLRKN